MGETGSEDERRGRGSGRRSLFGIVFLLGRYWAARGRQTEGRSSRRAISDGLEATYGLPYYSIDRYSGINQRVSNSVVVTHPSVDVSL